MQAVEKQFTGLKIRSYHFFDSPWIPDKARVQSNGFYDYRCTDPSPDGLDSAFRFPMSIQYAAPIGRYYVISTDLLPENNLQWSYFDYQDLPSRQDSTNPDLSLRRRCGNFG